MATGLSAFGAPLDLGVTLRRGHGRRPWPLRDVYELVIAHSRVSPAMLHRRLRIPTAKGEKYLELLEREGIVGPRESLGSREVLQKGNGPP